MKKIFVNGTFDVLHTGHLSLLNWAKSLGDHLLVAIDSDRRVTLRKGPSRPFNNELNRFTLMQNLKAVDAVKIFGSDGGLIDIIKDYQPDILVVGSDWRGKPVIGSEYAGRLEYFERIDDESTTKTIQRYIDRR